MPETMVLRPCFDPCAAPSPPIHPAYANGTFLLPHGAPNLPVGYQSVIYMVYWLDLGAIVVPLGFYIDQLGPNSNLSKRTLKTRRQT